jgi:hypothetical protein
LQILESFARFVALEHEGGDIGIEVHPEQHQRRRDGHDPGEGQDTFRMLDDDPGDSLHAEHTRETNRPSEGKPALAAPSVRPW